MSEKNRSSCIRPPGTWHHTSRAKTATKLAAKVVADLVEEGTRVVISHSNGPQVGMIHTAMNEFGKAHPDYTFAPMSVCSAMSQGYIGYDLQNAIRAELISRGIYKPVSTVLTQVVIDPYDEAFAEPEKIIGRVLNAEEAEAEEKRKLCHKGGRGPVQTYPCSTEATEDRRD